MKTHHVHRIQCYNYQPSAFTCLARSPADGLIAAGRADGAVEVYDEKREFIMIVRFPSNLIKSVEALGWFDGRRLFCTGSLGRVHELDLHTASVKHSALLTGSTIARCMVLLGNHLLVGNDEGFITLFSIESSSFTQIQTFPQLNGKILAIAATTSSKSKPLIAASTDNGSLVTLTYTQHSATVKRLLLTESVSTVVWSLLFVRNVLFSGDNCGNVSVWNPHTGGLIQTFPSHVGLVLALAVSDDASTVFSGGADATVRKYTRGSLDPAELHWELGSVLRGCRRDIRGLAYLPGLTYDPEAEAHNSDRRFEPHRLLAVGLDARLQLLSCAQAESVQLGPAQAHTTLASQVGRPRDQTKSAVVAHVAALPFWPLSIAPGRTRPVQYSTSLADDSITWSLLHYPDKLILMRLAERCRSAKAIDVSRSSTGSIRLARPVRGPLQLAEIRPKADAEVVCCAVTMVHGLLVAYSDLNRTCVLKVSYGQGYSAHGTDKYKLHPLICSAEQNALQVDETKMKVRIERVIWKRRGSKYSRLTASPSVSNGPSIEHSASSDTTSDTDTNEDDDPDELTPAAVARYFALDDNSQSSTTREPVPSRKRTHSRGSRPSDPGFAAIGPATPDQRKLGREWSGLPAAVCLAFTVDAASLILVTQKTYELCSVALDTGLERWRIRPVHDEALSVSVYALTVSPQPVDDALGYLLALNCSDGRVRLHSSVDGKSLFVCPCLASVTGHAPLPVRLAFAPSHQQSVTRLAVLYTNNQLTEWSLTSKQTDPDGEPGATSGSRTIRGQLNAWLTKFWRVMGDEFTTTFGLIHSLSYLDANTWLLVSDRYIIQLKPKRYAPGDIRRRVLQKDKSKKKKCFLFTSHFESIIQADALNATELAVVSVHSAKIAAQLTAPLQRKLFGL